MGTISMTLLELHFNPRNPVHSKRPSFSDIAVYLNSSNQLMLQWVEEPNLEFPKMGDLGAPLSEAGSLYKDLQNVYVGTQ